MATARSWRQTLPNMGGASSLLIRLVNSQHPHSSVDIGRTKSEVPDGIGQFASSIKSDEDPTSLAPVGKAAGLPEPFQCFASCPLLSNAPTRPISQAVSAATLVLTPRIRPTRFTPIALTKPLASVTTTEELPDDTRAYHPGLHAVSAETPPCTIPLPCEAPTSSLCLVPPRGEGRHLDARPSLRASPWLVTTSRPKLYRNSIRGALCLLPPEQEDRMTTLNQCCVAFGVTLLLLLLPLVFSVLNSRMETQTGGPPSHA
jgi:hypothetical protein